MTCYSTHLNYQIKKRKQTLFSNSLFHSLHTPTFCEVVVLTRYKLSHQQQMELLRGLTTIIPQRKDPDRKRNQSIVRRQQIMRRIKSAVLTDTRTKDEDVLSLREAEKKEEMEQK